MRRPLTISFLWFSLLLLAVWAFRAHPRVDPIFLNERADNPRARADQEFLMTRDPATNAVPERIFERELRFARTLPVRRSMVRSGGRLLKNASALTWTERGPTNVGGRTRALGIDVTDANIIIAGGVSGGLWKSTNDGATWTMATVAGQLKSVTCLVQDTRSGKTNTWYAGSGEYTGNSADQWDAYYSGDGIFKSTDNGVSWSLLASTSTNNPQSFDNFFDYVWNVAIDPSRSDSDIVYAATYGAIYRSNNGGVTWTSVIVGSSSYSTFTDVQVTSTGTVYAALSSDESSTKGIWKSSNGMSWTNITPSTLSTATYYRTVIGIAPSKEHTVYFLTNAQSIGKTGDYGDGSDNHTLLVYNSQTNAWVDRSANLPPQAGSVGGFSSQGSYDMLIRVKPDDSAFVVIGGTNLYRSTNGFTSAAGNTNTNWIGGYSVANDVSVYTNHHPDQHAGQFRPGSSSVFYSGNDGGVKKTSDISASTVAWTSLNNGYNVTQFYSISLAPESGSDTMMAGAQDNGTNLGTSSGASNWTQVETGDGTIVKVLSASKNLLLTAYQLGGLRRRNRAGSFIDEINPSTAINKLFVNPLAVDPGNDSIVYYPAGKSGSSATTSGLWRTTNIKASTVSWTSLTATDLGMRSGYTAYVSAVGVSTSNVANTVYYGSSDGVVKKAVNASGVGTLTVSTVTPPGLGGGTSSGGYVSSIAVDPTNSNKALVVLSNYNVQSLWLTTNGGSSWTDVEGNLAGSSGPSVRWATMFYINSILHAFIGTSTGLYVTNALDSSATVWVQEADESIGNTVVTMLDYRSADQMLAVATHGRGVFTAQITAPLAVELVAFTAHEESHDVVLEWETATELESASFEVQRDIGMDWHAIGSVAGSGSSSSRRSYSFRDRSAGWLSSASIKYRLSSVDRSGNSKTVGELAFAHDVLPSSFVLEQNYPNPFNPSTTVRYQLPAPADVLFSVTDMAGRIVARIPLGEKPSGDHTFTFTPNDLSSGMYFYTLSAGRHRSTRKMVYLK